MGRSDGAAACWDMVRHRGRSEVKRGSGSDQLPIKYSIYLSKLLSMKICRLLGPHDQLCDPDRAV